ncbi:hypothetical protein AB6G26_10760 [Providencia hangzhouensis]|uniref:hypothetical protein n=1 Tax=Providencia hangzhouensis TaxID=3031799 RepID=UPI0034DCF2A1
MSEISHLATDKDIVTMGTAIIGAICLVIGGAIGFFTKYFYENKKINESKKSLRQQMITNNIAPMRQAWINDLRSSVAGYLSDVYFIYVYESSSEGDGKKELKNEWMKRNISFLEKYNYIYLLLPFSRENKIEEKAESLRASLLKLNEMISNSKKTLESDIYNEIKNARELTKLLLKEEWDETQSLKEIK